HGAGRKWMRTECKDRLSAKFTPRQLCRTGMGSRVICQRCVACNLCAVACPVGCISLQKAETKDGRWYPEFFRINFSRCIFCGLCEEACPTTAIQLTPDFELGEYKRQDLVYEKEDLLISGPGKYPEYNFYRMAGMAIDGKDKGEAENEAKPIDVKSLLP
ncbi:NADH-quinone oxidoreductase subunit NuoI, partial [Salmonella enterica subsp. enterica serovar Kentucky]|nr:NADH-quinone oxidoreductase subunit NuoI [Salmonella enterica subsp. enterica serovar Kentucky]